MTTASKPVSPFLTSMSSLVSPKPSANAATDNVTPSVREANAEVVDPASTGSLGPSAGVPDPRPPAAAPATPVNTADKSSNPPVVRPGLDRKAVYPQIASASGDLAGMMASAGPSMSGASSPGRRGAGFAIKGVSLSQAVGAAVMSHPLMGAQAAKVTGSLADVRTSQGALSPQMQVYAGSGGSYLGTYANTPRLFGNVEIPGGSRSDAGFSLRQLVFDFGAARADIARSKSLVDAERLRLADQAEDIGLRAVNAYMNLLEQDELIALIDKVVADNNNFANLVSVSEQQGNGTAADVNRIKSKVIEVEALRADIVTASKTAEDEFFRLTKLGSSKVRRLPPVVARVPRTFDIAFESAKRYNPSLLALSAAGVSIDQQLESQRAQRLPRVDVQGDGLVKHYMGGVAQSQGIVDTRLMLMVSYKLLDGGIQSAQADRIREDRKVNDFRTIDECESIELNLKRFYQALESNRFKEKSALQGIVTAQKANSLYLEQFKAGKRTVFEVLDSRMVLFTMQKNVVNARYEQIRADYGILRNMGRLVETAINN